MSYDVGKRIKFFREQRELTQKEFACRIDAKNTTVSNWELGLTRPDVDTLVKICKVLEVSADEILDIQLPDDVFSDEEKTIIKQYRKRPELQQAVKILLDITLLKDKK